MDELDGEHQSLGRRVTRTSVPAMTTSAHKAGEQESELRHKEAGVHLRVGVSSALSELALAIPCAAGQPTAQSAKDRLPRRDSPVRL